MSLIVHIDKVPLFSTISEAQLWGLQYGLASYHEHEVLGQVGYMGGSTHLEAQIALIGGIVNPVSAQQVRTAAAGITTGGNGGNGGNGGTKETSNEATGGNQNQGGGGAAGGATGGSSEGRQGGGGYGG
tara:strand:+ start:435 stop:821 length:387 start_codon:yes stop_codon:yes gene_type:complete